MRCCMMAEQGSAADSALPRTELILKQDDRWERLEARLPRSDVEFRSRVDRVLCTLMPDYLDTCLAYYEGQGGQLQRVVDHEQLARLDGQLARLIEAATR